MKIFVLFCLLTANCSSSALGSEANVAPTVTCAVIAQPSATDALSAATEPLPAVEWKTLRRGVQYATIEGDVFGCPRHISVLRYKRSLFRTDVVSATGGDARTTSAFGKDNKALAALNGSYFDVARLTPVTYLKVDGKCVGHTRDNEMFRVDGLVAFRRHRMDIAVRDTASCAAFSRRYEDAAASGPVLIEDGVVRSGWPEDGFYSGLHPRTVFGYDRKGWAYLIVIDGRFPSHAVGMSIEHTAEVARLLGLHEAINLDGGGSCSLWIDGPGVISHPYDNRLWDNAGERTVPNALIIRW